MSAHRDAFSKPKIRISDQIHLLELFFLAHLLIDKEVFFDFISIFVGGFKVYRRSLMSINLKVDLLFFIFTLVFQHVLNNELWIIFI